MIHPWFTEHQTVHSKSYWKVYATVQCVWPYLPTVDAWEPVSMKLFSQNLQIKHVFPTLLSPSTRILKVTSAWTSSLCTPATAWIAMLLLKTTTLSHSSCSLLSCFAAICWDVQHMINSWLLLCLLLSKAYQNTQKRAPYRRSSSKHYWIQESQLNQLISSMSRMWCAQKRDADHNMWVLLNNNKLSKKK